MAPADTDLPLEEKLRKLPSPKVGDKQKPVEFVKVIGKIALYGKQDFECADGESPNLETFSAFGMFDTNALDVSKSLVVIGPLEPVGMPMGKRESHKLAHCVFLFLYTNTAGTVIVVMYNVAKQLCEEAGAREFIQTPLPGTPSSVLTRRAGVGGAPWPLYRQTSSRTMPS